MQGEFDPIRTPLQTGFVLLTIYGAFFGLLGLCAWVADLMIRAGY